MKLLSLYKELQDLLHGLDYCFVSHSFYMTGGQVHESIRINFDEEFQSIFLLPAIVNYCYQRGDLRVDRQYYEIMIYPAEV